MHEFEAWRHMAKENDEGVIAKAERKEEVWAR